MPDTVLGTEDVVKKETKLYRVYVLVGERNKKINIIRKK